MVFKSVKKSTTFQVTLDETPLKDSFRIFLLPVLQKWQV